MAVAIPHKGSRPNFLKYWLPVIFYAILVFLISALPGDDIPELFPGQSNPFHFFEYAVFGLLLSRAIRYQYPKEKILKRVMFTCTITVAYALFDEIHQFFVPGRTAAFSDVAIDMAGSFLGSLFFR